MKFKIKSDAYQYVLYQADSDVERAEDDDMDNIRGHRVVGHYTTIETLLDGVRQRLLKSKSKKARDLEDFLKVVVSSQQEIRAEIRKLAFLAKKAKPQPGANYAADLTARAASNQRVNYAIQTQSAQEEAAASVRLDGETRS